MAKQFNFVSVMSLLLLLFISTAIAGPETSKETPKGGIPAEATKTPGGALDVVAKFGAKADEKTDLSKPLLDAWKEACASTAPATIVIPKGTYFLSEALLQGPCKAPIELQVQGTIKAPADPKAHKEPKWVAFEQIENFKMSGGGTFDGQGTTAYKRKDEGNTEFSKNLPINIRFDKLTNAMIQDITSKDSKQFHVNVLGCKNITFDRFTVSAPAESLNTDGIHIGRSDGVNVHNCEIKTGDDCISIGDGSKNLDIQGITCGPGHGISIGSLGKYENEEPLEGIKVKKCTLSNTSNGVRIKSWPDEFPGTATEMHFEDITMNNVSCPVLIDQKYCPSNKCKQGESKVKLSNISFKNIRGTAALPEIVKLICSSAIPCENVELADIDVKYTGDKGPATSVCTNVMPKISGTNNPTPCSSTASAKPSPTV